MRRVLLSAISFMAAGALQGQQILTEDRQIDAVGKGVPSAFGIELAISGDTLAAGDHFRADGAAADTGVVFIFERDLGGPENWGQAKKVFAADGASGDYFGFALALEGNTLAVGAMRDGISIGAAYVYGRDVGGPGAWGEVTKITASDAAGGDNFGQALALDGDLIAVAASKPAVYLFRRSLGGAENWGQEHKIPVLGVGSVALQDGVLAIGDGSRVIGGVRTGAVDLFEEDQGGPGNWGQVATLVWTAPQI